VLQVEINLVKAFQWSLYEIDRTDINSLIPFYLHVSSGTGTGSNASQAYCDEVGWL
jgi:hypothetical protein